MATDGEMVERVARLQFPPRRVAGRGRGWYRGDCHVHSALSLGGELTVEQLAAGARATALDLIAITEHNTSDTHGAWGPLAGDEAARTWLAREAEVIDTDRLSPGEVARDIVMRTGLVSATVQQRPAATALAAFFATRAVLTTFPTGMLHLVGL